jgi:hypothetical protein
MMKFDTYQEFLNEDRNILGDEKNLTQAQLNWCKEHLFKSGWSSESRAIIKLPDTPGGKITTVSDVTIKDDTIERLPVEFADTTKEVRIHCSKLRTLKGLPEKCGAFVMTNNDKIISLDFLPKFDWIGIGLREYRGGIIMYSDEEDSSKVFPNLNADEVFVLNQILGSYTRYGIREEWNKFEGTFPEFVAKHKGKLKAKVAGLI